MPRLSTASELKRLVSSLQAERQGHTQAIAVIDQTFADLGIAASAAPAGKKRGRPFGSGKKAKDVVKVARGRRKRGRFEINGEDSVVKFVCANNGVTTKEVNAHWQAEGRKGKADNTLTKLVKQHKLKRVKIKGERGSKYHAP